jgi:hypothetical protein
MTVTGACQLPSLWVWRLVVLASSLSFYSLSSSSWLPAALRHVTRTSTRESDVINICDDVIDMCDGVTDNDCSVSPYTLV